MRNAFNWRPTKFVQRNGRLRASTDTAELGVGSRLIANLVAQAYDRSAHAHVFGRLLDMGCGKAPLYGLYSSLTTDVQCIDWGNSLHGADYLDKVCDLSGSIPYPDSSFDTILLSDVLEHLPEPKNCWSEMNRLLAPGGKVILNVPFYYQIHEEPHDYYRYTEFALRRFAKDSGFQVVELEPIGGPVEIIADITAKLLVSIRFSACARAVQYLAGSFSRTSIGRRIFRRSSMRFPLGYFMIAQKV